MRLSLFSFMAERITDYPEVNPIQMLPSVTLPSGKYTFRHYNEAWFTEMLKPWQGTRNFYYQKLLQAQNLTFQFHNNDGAVSFIQFVTSCGEVVWEQDLASVTVTGKTVTSQITGDSFTGYTYNYNTPMSNCGLDDGIYYLVIRSGFYDPTDPEADAGGNVYQILISEPLLLRAEHPNTMLLEYKNSVNAFDVFYNGTFTQEFNLVVESWLYDLDAKSTDTSYIDELSDVTPLDSVPFNTYTWAVRRVPEWMFNKINRVWSNDLVRIDHPYKYWTKDKDAKWEKVYNSNFAFQGYSLSIRPAKNFYSQQVSTQKPILVWRAMNNGDSGGVQRFPYFVKHAVLNRTLPFPVKLMTNLNGPPGPYPYSTDCWRVRDAADEQLLLDHANNVTKPAYGQLGYYAIVSTTFGDCSLYYYPHATETDYTTNSSVVLTRRMDLNFSGAWGFATLFDIKAAHVGYAIINQLGVQKVGGYGNGNPSLTHLVGGLTNLQGNIAQVFHYNQMTAVNTMTEFYANHFETPNLISVTGKYPETLTIFHVYQMAGYTTVNWSLFLPCAASLFSVSYYKCGVTTVQNMDVSLASQQLTALSTYDLSRAKMNSAMVDATFNQMYNGGGGNETFTQNNGEMYTNLQVPVAPPTGASATAINFIDNTMAWVVTTD